VIAAAEADRNHADARIAAAASVVSARQSFRDDGYRTMRSYLKGTLNCSGVRANEIRKQSTLINEHPAVGDTWIAGHIGTEQVKALATAHSHPRAAHRFAEFAPQLLDHAEHLVLDDLGVAVKHFIALADSDGALDDQQFHEDEASASVTVANGAIEVQARGGSPQQAEEISAVFELAVEAEFQNDCDARRREFGDDALTHPLPRTARQRKFAALHQIFMAWAAVPADGRTPEPLVNFVIDHVTAGKVLATHGLTDDADLFGIGAEAFDEAERDLLARRCHTTTGTSAHPDNVLKAMIEGRIRRVVVDADSVVVDLGRTSRLFTATSRSAAQVLVRSCTHRGCDIPARFCDVDHRKEWVADEGATDQANAMPLCGPHDRWKHTNRIRSRRAENGRIYLVRPDGTTIKPASERDPRWAEPPPFDTQPSATTATESGEPDHCRTISWTEFAASRPHLAGLPDLGWTPLQVTQL